jgi:hypothetical protein
MGNPFLLKQLPDVAAMLSEGGCEREQAVSLNGPTG